MRCPGWLLSPKPEVKWLPSPKEVVDLLPSPRDVAVGAGEVAARAGQVAVQTARKIDIKQWFIGVITPDFDTLEASVRLGDHKPGETGGFLPSPRLAEVTQDMRRSYRELASTPKQPGRLPSSLSDGYVSMDRPPAHQRWFRKLEPGSIRSTALALMASALGAGALALPYAFALTGWGLGLLTLFAAGMISALSLQVLMVAARYTGRTSYAQLLELAMGYKMGSLAVDLTVMLNGVGSIVCILIFEGDFVPSILKAPPGGLGGWRIGREVAILAAASAAWPLTLPDDISALRYVSIAAPVAITITALIVLSDTQEMQGPLLEQGLEVKWWDFEPLRWLKAASIMINAFANHQNAVPCANSFVHPSVERVVKSTVNANLAVWGLLSALGLGGYWSFAAATKGDFLLNYASGRPEIWICRLMLALLVYFALPVAILPTAKSAAQLFLRLIGRGGRPISGTAHAASATLLLVVCTATALQIQDVASVVGVLGGLLASSLMFWFPAIVFYQLLWPVQPRLFRGPVLFSMVLLGSVGWSSVFLNMLF